MIQIKINTADKMNRLQKIPTKCNKKYLKIKIDNLLDNTSDT